MLEKYHTVGGMCESVDIEGPTVTKVAIDVVNKMGAEVQSVVLQQRFKYFPLVNNMKLGFYEKLEFELQGLNNTYYVGSLLAFELTERNSSYAMAMACKPFVDDGVFFDELNEVLTRELAENGHSLAYENHHLCHPYPKREKGRRIRELTSVIQKINVPKNSVELYAEKVNNRGAIAQAESLRYKLLGGLVVCRILCISDLNVAVKICDSIGEPKPYVPESGASFFSAFPLRGTQQGALSSGGSVSATLLIGPLLAPKSIREAALQVVLHGVVNIITEPIGEEMR
ncbi:hypothetical protein IFM89_008571 [Coptis chinensis]|uniref:Uncharacterized protein n=1 Tax=Coptis chinensis TaxID=261450 RepID=A0A835I0M7_9MAGN|nr:hypothetical protein IFM89_008571 [Coptis chinensis]